MDTLQLTANEDPCRLCLKKCEQSYGMYVTSPDGLLRELPRKILECIALEISESEPQIFSKLVCSECICKLDYFHEFRENCRKCQAFFSEMMLFCHPEPVVDHQQHHDDSQQILPEITFSGHEFMLDGNTNNQYEYIIQSLEKEDISFTANVEALKLKKELEISIQQNQQQGKFLCMGEPSTSETVMPSEETCFNNLEAIVESITQQNAASGYIIEQEPPEDDLDYDDFVGIETVDENRDASISEIHVQEIIEQKLHPTSEDAPEAQPQLSEEISNKLDQELSTEKRNPSSLIEPDPKPAPLFPVLNDRTCDICGKVCTTRTKLKLHRNSHLKIFPFTCPMDNCAKAFKSKIGLDEHVAKHTGNYPLSCGVCGKGFMIQSYLTAHQRTHSDEKTFRCNICKQATFKSKRSLIDHKNRHLGLKPFECGQCGNQFTNRYLLQQHEQIAHTGVRFPCPQCDKSFTCKSYLKVHLRIHSNDRPYVCKVCQRPHLTRRDLEVHQTVHSGKKEFVCDVCGKGFARLNALTFHRKIHENRSKIVPVAAVGSDMMLQLENK
ncbi:zinc finger protein with KRAB and SCAN domains 8-like [Topomyia yanbarensis]|uniref:zinc finger protein with KRAB and SCAN domains 8-like n=1 Tax=Topomyia yanbarensis TaxID=2498891 RepID=UPI00273C031F|nr:zinc finger protein with KRAB and SCAN domains 8-like [Topomyia yanbarensis]